MCICNLINYKFIKVNLYGYGFSFSVLSLFKKYLSVGVNIYKSNK